MCVMEKQIILGCQFYFHVLKLLSLSGQGQDLDPDRFKSADFLGAAIRILDSKFEWGFTIEDYGVTLSKRWVHFFNGRKVKGVQHRLLSHIIRIQAILVLLFAHEFAI